MVRSLPPSNWQLHTVFARPARCSFHSTNETGQPEQKLYIFPPPHKFTRSPCCYFWLQGIRKCGVGVDSNSIKSIPTLVKIYQLVQCSNVRSTNPHTHTHSMWTRKPTFFFFHGGKYITAIILVCVLPSRSRNEIQRVNCLLVVAMEIMKLSVRLQVKSIYLLQIIGV